MSSVPSPSPLLPPSVPIHPPHRTGPASGFASFAGSLLPFGGTPSSSTAPLQVRRRRANAVSVPRPSLLELRDVDNRMEAEDAVPELRWGEEAIPTSPRESRKGSAAGMEWEGVVQGMEGVGLGDGAPSPSPIASTSAYMLPSSPPPVSASPASPPATPVFAFPLAPTTPQAPQRAMTSPTALPSFVAAMLTPPGSATPPRSRKRDLSSFLEEANEPEERKPKRGRTALGFFDVVTPSSSSHALGRATGMNMRPPRIRRTLSARPGLTMAVVSAF